MMCQWLLKLFHPIGLSSYKLKLLSYKLKCQPYHGYMHAFLNPARLIKKYNQSENGGRANK